MSEERIIPVGFCAIKFLGMYGIINYEPCMRKQESAHARTKAQITCAVTVQFLFFLKPKFQACSHLL